MENCISNPSISTNIETSAIFDDIIYVCKFILCVLLTQFGKTFLAINRITTEINQDEEKGKSIHIVFTMNTLLNNSQFAKRLEKIEKKYGKGSVCVLASKKNNSLYTHVKNELELLGLISRPSTCPKVIVMCSNVKRYADGVNFIKTLEDERLGGIQRVFAYYDELHEYITDDLRQKIEEINSLNIVSGIIGLSATANKIWEQNGTGFWSRLQLILLDNFNTEDYAGYSDMIFNEVNDYYHVPYVRPGPFAYDQLDYETVGFITHTLDRYPEILCDGSRTFIPGHKRRAGHKQIRELVFEIRPNAIVIVLNGEEKTLRYKDQNQHTKTVSLDPINNEEVCKTIYIKIKHHKLEGRPLVITGMICVGMGQTLTCEELGPFTSAIFGHMDLTNDEIYQLFGRTTGRMKNWSTYCQTQVYCPITIMHRCNVMETCAKVMATEHNGELVTQKDYCAPMLTMGEVGLAAITNIRVKKQKKAKKQEPEPEIHKFKTQEELKVHYTNILKPLLEKENPEVTKQGPRKRKPNEAEFFEATIRKNTKVYSCIEIHTERKCNITNGAGYAVRPCYQDPTNKDTLEWWLIYYNPPRPTPRKLVTNNQPQVIFVEEA
jgi:hypothetical protein